MSLIDLSLRARELSSDLFKLFVNHFGSERFFDYHLLHRYASLFNVSLVDHEVYRQVLHRLVGREGRPQPRSVHVRVPKLGIPFPLLRSATIGAHSRTSKYILTKELNIFALSAQITGYSYKQKKYSDIRCPSELVADMRDIMKVHFGSAFESDLECDVGLDNFLKIVVQQTNYSATIDESVFSAIKNQKLNYCVPRPADSFSKFIISNVPAESDIRYFGHNLAYSPIYEGDAVQNMFPPIKLQSLRYEDDIRSMKKSRMLGIVSRKDKILVPLFPFGDTGYSEIECNHFYQTNMLTEVRDVMQKHQKQVVFCLHPGTKNIEQIANMLQGFRYEIGVFDKYLSEAKLVICTYRGTTCLASAVANNVPTILLKDSGCDKPRRYNNLTICTIGQLNYEMDKSA